MPVYFEPRLIKVTLSEGVTEEFLDEAADEATEGLDDAERERVEQGVAVVNAVYGAPERIAALAADIVEHWEARRGVLAGKCMVVTMSRRIAVDLYNEIVRRRPDWHSEYDAAGKVKVVITGSATDPASFQPHIRNAAIFHPPQCICYRLPLGIQHRSFQRDIDMSLHRD